MTCWFCHDDQGIHIEKCPAVVQHAMLPHEGDWQVEHYLDYQHSDEWRATHGDNKNSFEYALIWALHYRLGCNVSWGRAIASKGEKLSMRIHNLVTGEILPIDEALETIIE